MPVYLVDYDPDWAADFQREQAGLAGFLAESILGVLHVGSTAIPGMPAKPVVDLMVLVDDIGRFEDLEGPLHQLGFQYHPYAEDRTPERRWFYKGTVAHRTHHLHLVQADSPFHRDVVTFRDTLREDPIAAAQYAALKRDLARRFPTDREAYTQAKTGFVRDVLTAEDHLARIEVLAKALAEVAPHLGPRSKTPLSEAQIEAFEAREGVLLPHGYRRFLLAFGDEALIPNALGCQALPLHAYRDDPVWRSFGGPLSADFTHTGDQPLSLDWDDDADDYVRMDHLRGTICLGSAGCDEIRVLVVTGLARGTVWDFVPGLDTELHPTNLGFLAWCVQWLGWRLEQLGGTPEETR